MSEGATSDLQELEGSSAVATWFAGLEQQWGEPLSPTERASKLKSIQRFVELAQRTPEQIVSDCLIVRDGAKKISPKGRRLYSERILEFQGIAGLTSANDVRSFLIYNGILLQTPLSK